MKLKIKNFRSIEDQEIQIAPITVLYGPNGAGKSSLLYALLTFQKLVHGSNQDPMRLFSYGSVNLGDFDSVVFDHLSKRTIEFCLTRNFRGALIEYQVELKKENVGTYRASVQDTKGPCVDLALPVSFPYSANQRIEREIRYGEEHFKVSWDGISARPDRFNLGTKIYRSPRRLAENLNFIPRLFGHLDIVPLKRGFSNPYPPSIPGGDFGSEDGLVFKLLHVEGLEAEVRDYVKEIFHKDFHVRKLGIGRVALEITDRESGLTCNLVNEGFGLNQTVFMLVKCLQFDHGLMLIEEPEIHLHPTAIRNLARALVQIGRVKKEPFLVSTHSESFLLAMLASVARAELKPEDLACYLVQKKKKTTVFERQAVNEDGQVDGGLSSFLEGELEDVKAFLGVDE